MPTKTEFKKLWKNKKITTPLFGGLIFLWAIFSVLNNPLKNWEQKAESYLYNFNPPPSTEIIIVGINKETLNELGPYSTWNRSYFTQVIKNISKYNPKVIGLDIFFQRPKDENLDQELKLALKENSKNVLIFTTQPLRVNKTQLYNTAEAPNDFLPFSLLRELTNTTFALNNVLVEEGKIVDKMFVGAYDELTDKFYETFPFALIRSSLDGSSIENIPTINQTSYIQDFGNNQKIIPLEDGQMRINYFSKSGVLNKKNVQNISFIDAYNNQFNPLHFTNKIVLIGGYDDSFQDDNFYTPIDSNFRMPGVEIHANALQTILDEKFLRPQSTISQIITVLLLIAASSYLFMYRRLLYGVIFLLTFAIGYPIIAIPFFQNGLILHLINPYLAIFPLFIICLLYRYQSEFSEKASLKSAFSKYVNPTLAEKIANEPEKLQLGGEKRRVSVIFTDIAHFTSISEKLTAPDLVKLLNEYFEAMVEIIFANGGTLDKYEGDAIMAFFGAPLDDPNHEHHAVITALQMRQKLSELRQQWAQNPALLAANINPQEIDFRCGINTGEVIVGNIGSSKRFEYTVIGDDVNLASRLEGANKKYQTHLMISEHTYEKVKDQFACRELDLIRVVGKTQPIRVYEILGPANQLSPAAQQLLQAYEQGISLYHTRKFAEALQKFQEILKTYPADGPSNLYAQRCEVLRDFPPAETWDGVYEMGTK